MYFNALSKHFMMEQACFDVFWEDVITAEDGVITVRCAVHTLQLSVLSFLKLILASKVRNVAKKTQKQNIEKLFMHNNKLPP